MHIDNLDTLKNKDDDYLFASKKGASTMHCVDAQKPLQRPAVSRMSKP